jgi:glycerophosphoryl diester phosphodiesterase
MRFSPRYTYGMQTNSMKRWWCVLGMATLLFVSPSNAAEPKPLMHAHAHNDYEHTRPLLDALDHGFCSVEADVWLTPEGLLVAHDRKDLKPERTLESLYLQPLRERVKTNGGKVYRDGPQFYLLVDVKTEAEATYAALVPVLAKYADILSVIRYGKLEPNAVTVVLSGNRAFETIATHPVRYVGIDGRPENLAANPPVELYPWVSANWTLLFKWKGDGPMPEAERKNLREFVKLAQEQKRKVRFWATAEKEAVWKELLEAGVDLVNTDKLHELQQFLINN